MVVAADKHLVEVVVAVVLDILVAAAAGPSSQLPLRQPLTCQSFAASFRPSCSA